MQERAHNNSSNPWRRWGHCAIALSLYTDQANQVLICLKAAIWEAAQIHTEFSIEIQGVDDTFWILQEDWAPSFHGKHIKFLLPFSFFTFRVLQILVQLAFLIYWLVSLCASQSFHPIFLFTLNFSLSFITSGQIIVFLHLIISSIESTLSLSIPFIFRN